MRALVLDELTAECELAEFVLFSSAAATFGSAGQASYAAANAVLDALAAQRRLRGLPGTSVAWGLWQQPTGMTGHLDQGDRQRVGGLGGALSPGQGLGLLDAARGREQAVLVAAGLDIAGLRAVAAAGAEVPALLRGLVRAPAPAAADGAAGGLAGRLAGLGAAEQERVVLEVVRAQAASVLGHASLEAVAPGGVFRELGFDSLTAIELRNRLAAATGLRLPATLVFDYPTAAVLASWLRGELAGSVVAPAGLVVRAASEEPVAIVSMSCRFPGRVTTPEQLWDLVAAGTDAVSAFPGDRDWGELGGAGAGGFVYGVAEFDPGFFGISPREAIAMDPQQRLLLELAWEALERAGIDPASVRGTATGVFAGVSGSEYGSVLTSGGAPGSEGYLLTGTTGSVVSGRVAYVFGLEGPAVSVDTACSSSLVALHLACQALRAGECTMALAGGVTVMATPGIFAEFGLQGGLAADGRCKSFSAAADGMGWAEGAGLVLVERLSDAQRLGHRVLAVVAGSAVNQDGASNGLTAPNGPSQQRVIRQALASAGVAAAGVDVVEAHGTGTTLGDPIEAQALLATYGQDRPDDQPLWLGSVKSNFGHAQAAAGIAGVIKTVMALGQGVLPPTLHAGEPSPHVDWSAGAVRLLTEPRPWPQHQDGRPRRAGVSSFGISGTNAHLILEQAPVEQDLVEPVPAAGAGAAVVAGGAVPWVVSGRGGAGLAAQAQRLAVFARGGAGGAGLVDVGYSLAAGRACLADRAVVLAGDAGAMAAGLAAVAAGESAEGVVRGTAATGDVSPGVVFVFPGQGSQWAGMAAGLMAGSPVFAAAMAECAAALERWVDWPVLDVVTGAAGAPGLDRAEVVQPALFAVMVSLARTWQALGVVPAAVAGHSQGEIAAAHIAGALSLADAARVVAVRSQALAALTGQGGMVSAAVGADRAGELAARWDGLSVAAVNGPAQVVFSGPVGVLAELTAWCAAEGIWAQRVPVDYAAHSAQVEAIRGPLLEGLAQITPLAGRVPFYSAVAGGRAETVGLDGEYWYRNLRQRVRFEETIGALAADGHRVFVEVSPHPVLAGAIEDTLEAVAGQAGGPVVVTGTLRRGQGGAERMLASAAGLFVRGIDVDWAGLLAAEGGRRVDVPTQAFVRQRYWPQPPRAAGIGDVAAAGLRVAGHPLLAASVELAGDQGLVFTGRLSVRAQPWLADHVVLGTVLLPAAGFVEMASWAGRQAGCGLVAELTLEAPLVLPDDGGVRVQVRVGAPDAEGRREVSVHSQAEEGLDHGDGDAGWVRHAGGLLATGNRSAELGAGLGGEMAWPPAGAEPVVVTGFYDAAAAGGYEYGPAFQGLRAAWRRGDEVFAEVCLPEEVAGEAGRFGVHPALLDAVLQAAGLGVPEQDQGAGGGVRLPFAWSGVWVAEDGPVALRARVSRAGPDAVAVVAVGSDDRVAVVVERLVLRPVPAGALAVRGAYHPSLFAVDWVKIPAPAGMAGRWALLGEDRWQVSGAAGLVERYGGLAELAAAVAAGGGVPGVVVACLPAVGDAGVDRDVGGGGDAGGGEADAGGVVRAAVGWVLGLVQGWVAGERFGSSVLVVVTRGGVLAGDGTGADPGGVGLAGAAVQGLVRSAQAEHPGRLVLADIDDSPASGRVLVAAVGCGEPEVVVRDGGVFARRLGRVPADPGLVAGGAPWRVAVGGGSLGDVGVVADPSSGEPLGAGQVRVVVRAAGLNFRDVLIGLGMYPGPAVAGAEGAGVVVETGPGVAGLVAGDRVLGLMAGLGSVAVTDARVLVKIPAGWSFTRAASVPVAFATAYYALVDLAGLRAGESVLIHAGTGGVGMAAIQVARYLGAEVFATASEGKWPVLAGLGLPPERIASSRSTGFADQFAIATGGRGVDVVLNSLAGELTDASLGLLAPGGRFIEMGKTDPRDPAQVGERWPGVGYQAFDVAEVDPDRLGEILAEVVRLLAAGDLGLLPVRAWQAGAAGAALRFMSQARHVGKLVLTYPVPADPGGTVLVTGGTGVLGGLVARHLASGHRAGRVVLASRSGPAAAGAAVLAARVAGAGAEVVVAACDVADKDAVGALVARAPGLSGVYHAAGVLDDGVVTALTPARANAVLRPKVDAAVHLDELTAGLGLAEFVLFSSAAATFGSAGQGSYAAANAVLDALAAQRRLRGLPGTSVAWGLWQQPTGMTGHLDQGDRQRVGGLGGALSLGQGLGLLDAVRGREQAVLVAAGLDIAGLRAVAAAGAEVPALLRGLVRAPAPAAADGAAGGLAGRLAGLGAAEQERVVLEVVRAQAASVLGHASAEAVPAGAVFRDLGFDSLTAIELRNRLGAATGLRLPATLVFDYPTAAVLASWLRGELAGSVVAPAGLVVRAASEEPVAIVSMSCRFPGGASTPEQLWDLVAAGTDAVSALPADRDWGELGGTGAGGFVYGVAEFDPGFFGISPREALAMDPQQRLLLELAWEAFERAGIDPASMRGTATGVYAGTAGPDYPALLGLSADRGEGHVVTGNAASVVSGRVAYVFGLEGPAVSVDTACSSSLVALHLACQALRAGECTMALAGGVTVMATPGTFAEFGMAGALASDGRCKAFSAAADGMGLAEGAGLVLAERVSDAQRQGHRVLAVVRGSAVNQDGASNGLTAPNGPSQQRVIRQALASAGVTAAEVDVVEAHGTGTTLGDPIEAQALLATYGQGRPDDQPLWLGSVKSNIGHTQAAAGIAGVIKTVLALGQGQLPPTLHVEERSPHVDWSAGNIQLLKEARPWPQKGHPRRAGVSSFGISGTNAHLILEQAPPGVERAPADAAGAGAAVVAGGVVPWVVSGRGAGGLAAQARRLAVFTRGGAGGAGLVDVGYSLAAGRACLADRAVVVAGDAGAMAAGLAAVAAGEPAEGVVRGTAVAGEPPGVVFVFPGQGSQWAGMAAGLMAESPVFAAAMAECAAALEPWVDWPVLDVVTGKEGAPGLDRAEVVQPALFAVMVSLARTWQALGVKPAAVAGHSQGEIAAAHIAGGLSLGDAARVVAVRSQALAGLAGRGGMVSVAVGAERAGELASRWDGLGVAAVNGPAQVVFSGPAGVLEELTGWCAAEGVWAQRVPVDYAAHSAQVEAIRGPLLEGLAPVVPQAGDVPFYSAVTGERAGTAGLDGEYWYRNLRERVRFEDVIGALAAAGHRVFIEVSPHPVLAGAIEDTLEVGAGEGRAGGGPVVVTGTLRRGQGGAQRMLASAAGLFVHGVGVDWAGLLAAHGGRRIDLPTYAFQRQRYWPQPASVPVALARDEGGEQARFWAAVEAEDVAALVGAMGADDSARASLGGVLPVLSAWRRDSQQRAVVDRWRYRVTWQPVADPAPGVLGGRWLVVVPAGDAAGGLAEGCIAALGAQGAHVVMLEVGPDLAGAGLDRAALAARIGAVLSSPGADDCGEVAGVVSLLALDESPAAGVAAGVARTLVLVQALGDVGVGGRWWVLTKGAVAAGPDDRLSSPVQAQVWGLGRIAALEYPQRWGGLVDLPPLLAGRAAERLCGLLGGAGEQLAGEDQVAIREGGCWRGGWCAPRCRAAATETAAGRAWCRARYWSPAAPGCWAGTRPGGQLAVASARWCWPAAGGRRRREWRVWPPNWPGGAPVSWWRGAMRPTGRRLVASWPG